MGKDIVIKLKENEWEVSQCDPDRSGLCVRIFFKNGKRVRAEVGKVLDTKELRKRVKEIDNGGKSN